MTTVLRNGGGGQNIFETRRVSPEYSLNAHLVPKEEQSSICKCKNCILAKQMSSAMLEGPAPSSLTAENSETETVGLTTFCETRLKMQANYCLVADETSLYPSSGKKN